MFQASGICERTAHAVDARCIFFDGIVSVPEIEFFDELERALKQPEVLPDCLVVLADSRSIERLRDYWDSNAERRQNIRDRGGRAGVPYVKSYHFFAWKSEGLEEIPSKHGNAGQFKVPALGFIQQGLAALVRKNSPVQVAPSGHVFKHPSGTINPVFIQARELAKVEPELCFVGRALCLAVSPEILKDLSVVLIDTMGIYSYVREALNFLQSDARIDSFHSYEELEKLNAPHAPYLVVISASTSGGMARKFHKKQRFDSQRLVTMIDVSAKERSGAVLIALDEIDETIGKLVSDGSETQIEIVGEHFSSKAKPPRPVVLGLPHDPRPLENFLNNFGRGSFKRINTAAPTSQRSRLICFDSGVLAGNKKFEKWLTAEIQWRVPITTDLVIHADDQGSKAIAEMAAKVVSSIKNQQQPPPLLSAHAVNEEAMSGRAGVLIVSASAGDGGQLREISRDLRASLPPDTPRHFLVGVGLPQSSESWDRLKQFLERNRTERNYGFSAWSVLPVGPDGLDHAWDRLAELSKIGQMDRDVTTFVDRNIAEESLKQMSECINGARNGFLPNSAGGPLKVTDGFVFFKKVFEGKHEEIADSISYLTVAAVLQCARELKNPEQQLKPTGYESVVLHPECFLRFNDDILQACILGARRATVFSGRYEAVVGGPARRTTLRTGLGYSEDHGGGRGRAETGQRGRRGHEAMGVGL